jgi:hypothetical protein
MAQAVRPLPHRPAAPRPPHLRVVPRAARGPDTPGPQVIRRRRLTALAGLLALALVPPAWLALTAPAPGDRGQIAALLAAGARDPAALCQHLSTSMLRSVGGRGACLAESPSRGPGGSVGAIHVRGATATAVLRGAEGDERVRLVRQGGAWKVDDVR